MSISFISRTMASLWLLCLSAQAATKTYYPAPLLMLDNYFGHHILVAEKSTHKLHLFEARKGVPRLVKSYEMATGKKAGNKLFKGDFRTPEGVYHFTEFLTHKELLSRYGDEGKIYGIGAFVMDYPNPIDRLQKKTGGGIWLHSTNDEDRIDNKLDSRGCLVTANKNLMEISQYLELNRTTVVVVHHLDYLQEEAWKKARQEILASVEKWLRAWRSESLKEYISHYHDDFFDRVRGDNLRRYKARKTSIFANPGRPEIKSSHINILQTREYAVVTFLQDYKSRTIADAGKKVLYLKRDAYYRWKIVAETWSKKGISDYPQGGNVAFQPSMRFFPSRGILRTFSQEKKKGNN